MEQTFEDKTIICKDCGAEFVFTAGEQEFYKSRDLQHEPQRCKVCRDQKKRRNFRSSYDNNRAA